MRNCFNTVFITACLVCLLVGEAGKTTVTQQAAVSYSAAALAAPDTVPDLLTIDIGKEYQTIHSFGASDCWTAKFVGKWKDEKKKNEIADLLFSTANLADGSPKGIGLSLWRFNIGAAAIKSY